MVSPMSSRRTLGVSLVACVAIGATIVALWSTSDSVVPVAIERAPELDDGSMEPLVVEGPSSGFGSVRTAREDEATVAAAPIEPEVVRTSLAERKKSFLPEVAILEGLLVHDSTNEPITGARVRVFDEVTNVERNCEVDAEGRFTAKPFVAGHALSIEVRRGDWIAQAIAVEPLHIGVNERTIRVEAQVLVRGRVVELDTMRAIEGASVVVDSGPKVSVRSDADGSFVVYRARTPASKDAEAPDSISIEVRPEVGFGSITRISSAALAVDREWLVFVGRGCRISGTVRTEAGRPIPGLGEIRIGVAPFLDRTFPDLTDGAMRGALGGSNLTAKVDSSGRFAFLAVPPRLRRSIEVELPSGSELTYPLPYLELDGSETEVSLTVPTHPGVLEIATRRASGSVEAKISWSGPGSRGEKRTAPDGTLRIDGLPPGRLEVRARFVEEVTTKDVAGDSHAHRDDGPSLHRVVEIRSDGVTKLTLEILDDRSLGGIVVDRDGKPIAGVRVVVKEIEDWMASFRKKGGEKKPRPVVPYQAHAITESSGAFRFAELPPAPRWLVGLDDPRYRYDGEDVAAGSDGIELIAIDASEPKARDKRER